MMNGSLSLKNILGCQMIYPTRLSAAKGSSGKRSNQRGVATLLTAVVLMLAVFSITYVISEVVISEKQTVANELRSKQAFQAAYAGMEYARVVAADGGCTVVGTCVGSVSGATYSVIASGSTSLITLTSTGTSDDGSVARVINIAIGRIPGEAVPPAVPIVARGGLGLTGNVKAINNEEAITVWSGSDFTAGGSANTYINVDGEDNQLSTIKATGNATAIYGPDIITNDGNLTDPKTSTEELLQAFFNKSSLTDFGEEDGRTLQEFDDMSSYNQATDWEQDYTYYSASDVSLGNSNISNGTVEDASFDKLAAIKGLYDLDGDPDGTAVKDNFLSSASVAGTNLTYSNSAILGSPSNPVLIVVNGTLTLNSSPTIFGLIIANKIVMSGSPIIIGGIVLTEDGKNPDGTSNGEVSMSGAGTPTIIMDKTVLGRSTQSDDYGTVSNSWKDW